MGVIGKVLHGVVPVRSPDPRQIIHTVCNTCPKRFTHVKILPPGMIAKGRFAALTSLPSNRLVETLALHRGIEDLDKPSGGLGRKWVNISAQSREMSGKEPSNKDQKKGASSKGRG